MPKTMGFILMLITIINNLRSEMPPFPWESGISKN